MALLGTGLVLHLSESSPKASVGFSLAKEEGCGGMCLEKGMGVSSWSQRDAQCRDFSLLDPCRPAESSKKPKKEKKKEKKNKKKKKHKKEKKKDKDKHSKKDAAPSSSDSSPDRDKR